MEEWINVAPLDELPNGSHKVVEADGAAIAVFNIDGQYYAIEDVCTHDGGDLASGDVSGDEVMCPRHGARFCIRTGAVLSPPAYENVAVFPVRIDNGMVQVRDDRWD